MPRLTIFTLAAICLICSSTVRGWNATGHEICAQIAWDELTPGARAKIAQVLTHHPRYEKDLLDRHVEGADPSLEAFLRAATWPDMVRSTQNPMSHAESHPNWHFYDFPYAIDGTPVTQPSDADDLPGAPANLVAALKFVSAQLKDPATPSDRKAIDLCWVEHLVADAHQPLHAISLYSTEFPQGDQGGSLELVHAENPSITLHAEWDNLEGLSMNPNVIRKSASRLQELHPLDEKDRPLGTTGDALTWIHEGYDLAKSAVYLNGTLSHARVGVRGQNVPLLPNGYIQAARAVADQRLALGGHRLAALLENLAKSL